MFENPDWTKTERIDPYAPSDFHQGSYTQNSSSMIPTNVYSSKEGIYQNFKSNSWKGYAITGAILSYLGIVFVIGNGLVSLRWRGGFNPFENIFNIGGWLVFAMTAVFSFLWSKKSKASGISMKAKTSLVPISLISLILAALSLFTGAGAIAIIPFLIFPVWVLLAIPTLIDYAFGQRISDRKFGR